MAESQPKAAAMRGSFLKEAEAKLKTMPNQPLEAMRAVIRGGKYFFLGTEIPQKAITKAGGISRVVDLPSIFKFYLDPSYKAKFKTPEEFSAAADRGKFDPVKDIDDRKLMKGIQGVKETWWFPSNEANAVDLDGLREQLYIQDNPAYAQGAVRCDLAPEVIQEIGIHIYKPSAFDGLMQGWGTNPWWITKPGTWGITKNDTHEAVQKSLQWRFYKDRHLIKPTSVPAAADADAKTPAARGPGTGGEPKKS
jgi:hypothetical protein